MRRIRIDFYIAFIVAFSIGVLFNFCAGKVIDVLEDKSHERVYSDTEIGAAAGEGTPVVSSIEEMMEEEYFTCYVSGSMLVETVYYNSKSYRIYTLASGESVLVDEYFYHTYYDHNKDEDNTFHGSYKVLPVGRVIKKQLEDELIYKINEKGYELTDTSFYIDMHGDFKDFSRDHFESIALNISFAVGFIIFLLIRYIMIVSGLFPALFPLRFLRSWKKYIIYYGVVYYGEGIDKISALRKQGDLTNAAFEFSKLAEVSQEEAVKAMEYWREIYGEGILNIREE